jgi:hypothetical protein
MWVFGCCVDSSGSEGAFLGTVNLSGSVCLPHVILHVVFVNLSLHKNFMLKLLYIQYRVGV